MTTTPRHPNQPAYSPYEYKTRLGSALLALTVFYASMLFLNAEGIQKDIELLEYGPWRTACLTAFYPVAAFSRSLKLTQPKAWIKQTAGAWIQHGSITP